MCSKNIHIWTQPTPLRCYDCLRVADIQLGRSLGTFPLGQMSCRCGLPLGQPPPSAVLLQASHHRFFPAYFVSIPSPSYTISCSKPATDETVRLPTGMSGLEPLAALGLTCNNFIKLQARNAEASPTAHSMTSSSSANSVARS